MEPKLRAYIENLFLTAPNTQQADELKEEIIKNTIERYHDLLGEGKTEAEAYNLAIAGVGDINELIEALGGEAISEGEYTSNTYAEQNNTENTYTDEQLSVIKSRSSIFTGIAVALYILCFTPCIIFDRTPLSNISAAFMFFMISVATGLLIYGSKTKYIPLEQNPETVAKTKKKALITATAVGLYISCATPCIVFADTFLETISPIFMFVLIALATLMLIFNSNKNVEKPSKNTINNYKEWDTEIKKKKTSPFYKLIVAVIWIVASFLYIYITIATAPFTVVVTWIIFLIAFAVQRLIRAIFDYAEA